MTKLKKRTRGYKQGYTLGKLLYGTECQLLLDTGASTSFMSKYYYMHCKSNYLYQNLPKNTENSGRKGSICQCIIYNPSNNTCTQT